MASKGYAARLAIYRAAITLYGKTAGAAEGSAYTRDYLREMAGQARAARTAALTLERATAHDLEMSAAWAAEATYWEGVAATSRPK